MVLPNSLSDYEMIIVSTAMSQLQSLPGSCRSPCTASRGMHENSRGFCLWKPHHSNHWLTAFAGSACILQRWDTRNYANLCRNSHEVVERCGCSGLSGLWLFLWRILGAVLANTWGLLIVTPRRALAKAMWSCRHDTWLLALELGFILMGIFSIFSLCVCVWGD